MSNKKTTSIRDIAKLCNVSPSTVSRVINNTGRISQEKREEILNAIKNSDYTVAQNNKKAFSNQLIGILFPSCNSYFHPHLITELEKKITEKGYVPFILFHQDNQEIEQNCLNVLSELDIKGLIAIPSSRTIQQNYISHFSNIPTIFVDTIAQEPYFTVNSDQFYGGQLAGLEFISKGCRKPLIISRGSLTNATNLRVDGFLDIFKKNGIKISKTRILNRNRTKGAFTEAKDLIKYAYIKGIEFDCVFADSDWKAFGSLVALQELGFIVPDDIKIIGYDYSDITRYTYLPITSISQEIKLYASTITETIFQLMHHEYEEIKHNIVIPVSLKVGKTT